MDKFALLNDEIKRIEKKININRYFINGINIWPIIRTAYLTNQYRIKFGESPVKPNKFNLRTFYFHIIDFFKVFKIFTKKNKNLFLYYANDKSSNIIINDQTINKHFTPFEFKYGKNNIINIEIGKIDSSIPRPNALNISLLYFLVRPFLLIYYKFNLRTELNLVKKYSEELVAFDKQLTEDIYEFFSLKVFIKQVLKINKPKRVFVKSFDNIHSFSVIGAANELGINTIEYQHGQQGENSLRYSNWNNIPPEGFKIIPKTFWLWEEIFERKFDKWISSQKFHNTHIGGNIWIKYYHKYLDLKKIETIKMSNKYNILYCLQFVSIPKIIIDAIKNSYNTIWYLRLHPRYKNESSKILNILKQNNINIDNIEIDLSNNLLLEELMPEMDCVISGYSTVLYEAYILGKKAITIDSIGKAAYKEFINQQLIFSAANTKELISLLEN